ncbi:MAG: hypothetical protein IT210_26770 [Armatimonadetes bacterium]|nr:hypothetical protein [Armatimonadota bacterium]
MPHEVFVDYALWIEEASPFPHTMILACANGCESYIPTDPDLSLGGYEAGQSLDMAAALRYPYRTVLRPGAERMIREAVSALFEELMAPCL